MLFGAGWEVGGVVCIYLPKCVSTRMGLAFYVF